MEAQCLNPRNHTVDILRGLAMLLVVLGHTISGCTTNYQNTFIFNAIWTLQMPLFILIRGYVTKYSRNIQTGKDLLNFIMKRTLSYLLPWFVWTIIIRGLIFQQTNYFNIKFLVYNMDSGYWFLFTIWTIAMIYGISQYLSQKMFANKGKYIKITAFTVLYIIGMAVLGVIGSMMGLSFLCIKLTLYYMPFYFLGFFFGQVKPELEKRKYSGRVKELVIALCFAIWLILMQRYNFYAIEDGIFEIILKAVASLAGCVSICGFVAKFVGNSKNVLAAGFEWIGVHSLDIYLIHSLILCIVKSYVLPEMFTIQGVIVVVLNFVLTMGFAALVIKLTNTNKVLNTFLYGRLK